MDDDEPSDWSARRTQPLAFGELLRLYIVFMWAGIQSQLVYRWSFLLWATGTFVSNGLEFVALLVLFGRAPALGGWSAREVALLWGMSAMSFAFAEAFGGGFEKLANAVRSGEFDRMLTRPVPVFFQVLASLVELHRVGRFLQGTAAVMWADLGRELRWTGLDYLLLTSAVVTGAVIFFATFVLGGAWAFVSVDGQELVNTFTYGGTTLASYPIDLFADPVRRIVTWVFPLAFVNYFPALVLLRRVENAVALPFGLAFADTVWLAPCVAVVFTTVAAVVWRVSLRRYQSTGS